MMRYINLKFSTIRELLDFYHLSKTNIYKLINTRSILVNDTVVKSDDYNIKENDVILINDKIVKQTTYFPWNIKLDILYEDEDILIVYKPAFMLIHPDGNTEETLVNGVANYYKDKDIVFEHLHRLDFETKGMVVFSKNILSHTYLTYQWEKCLVSKHYIAKCYGKFKEKEGIIDLPIARDRHLNKYRVALNGEKGAMTKYKVLEYKDGISLVDIEIIGGRRHQIRVHLSYLNHPIVGDKIYGKSVDEYELMLKFYKITFIHPRTLSPFTFEIDKSI